MQLLPSLSQGAHTVKREQAAGMHLPYARHVNDCTLETRDGLSQTRNLRRRRQTHIDLLGRRCLN